MKLTCNNPRCTESNNGKPYKWDYKGKLTLYASCPRCKSSIRIDGEKPQAVNSDLSSSSEVES